MDLAKSARRVSPATAEMSQDAAAIHEHDDYKVEAAENTDDMSNYVTKIDNVGPAVTIDDARQFAPVQQLDKPHFDKARGISIEKLENGGSSISFQAEVGVCRGMQINAVRKVTLALSKLAPCIWDQRDFVSYGEIKRYVAIKDHVLFVYAQKADPNYIYTVPLSSLKAARENPKKPHKRTVTVSPGYGEGIDRQDDSLVNVLLLDARDKLAYQIVFDTRNDAEAVTRFILAVENSNIVEKKQEKIWKE